MPKLITTLLLCFTLANSFAQKQKKISTYLSAQFNTTLYDLTKGNNPWGAGLGVQSFLNNNTRFRPTIELTGDTYLEDDKVLRADSNGTPLGDVRGMVNLFIGTTFHPTKNLSLSVTAGPSFINGQTLLGIKPSVGFYLSGSQRWRGKISYINIFNRGNIIREDFGSLSIAVALKLF